MPRKRSKLNQAQCLEKCQLQIGCESCNLPIGAREIFKQIRQDCSNPETNSLICGNKRETRQLQNSIRTSNQHVAEKEGRRSTTRMGRDATRKIAKRGRRPWLSKHDELLNGCLSVFGNDLRKIRLFLTEFSVKTIRKKIALLGRKNCAITGPSSSNAGKPSITNSDNRDFLNPQSSCLSCAGFKVKIPNPSLAQTLLKITSIDVDGLFAETEPVHKYAPSIECFEFAHPSRRTNMERVPQSQFQTVSLIFPEKNCLIDKLTISDKINAGPKENKGESELVCYPLNYSLLRSLDKIGFGQDFDVQSFTCNRSDARKHSWEQVRSISRLGQATDQVVSQRMSRLHQSPNSLSQ